MTLRNGKFTKFYTISKTSVGKIRNKSKLFLLQIILQTAIFYIFATQYKRK